MVLPVAGSRSIEVAPTFWDLGYNSPPPRTYTYIYKHTKVKSSDSTTRTADLPLCLGVLKHRASLTHRPAKNICTMVFCLCGAILNLKAFCFGAIPDIMIEFIAYWSAPQCRQTWQWISGIETKLLEASGYWQKKLKMDSCLHGAILNLTAFCSIWTLIEECSSIK